MNARVQFLTIVGGATIVFFLNGLAAVSEAPQTATEPTEMRDAESLRLRYARANLQLTKLDLEIILAGNKQVANLHPTQTILRLRDNVAYAQDALDYELDPTPDRWRRLRLREVERASKLAESELASAIAANRRAPGSVSDLVIERLRTAAEIARLSLQISRDPAETLPTEDQLRWQLEQLRSELTRLSVQLEEVLSHL